MMKLHDPLLPASVVLNRLEKHQAALQSKLEKTPKWHFVTRHRLQGAIAAYEYEIEQLLEITAKWQPFWGKMK